MEVISILLRLSQVVPSNTQNQIPFLELIHRINSTMMVHRFLTARHVTWSSRIATSSVGCSHSAMEMCNVSTHMVLLYLQHNVLVMPTAVVGLLRKPHGQKLYMLWNAM